MDSFLDSCVIIHYSNYLGENSGLLLRKCWRFINEKNGKFMLCYAVSEEISNFISRREKVHKEVLKKLKDGDYQFSNSLDFRSMSTAKKLYAEFGDKNYDKVEIYFREQRENSSLKIEYFLLRILNEKVIPLNQIDKNLVSKINNYISNHADSGILASALQSQKGRNLFLFVTADKDFAPNEYDFLKEQFEINYSEGKYKFPELLNLMFTN